jgi:hypothetical protein
VRSLGRGNYTSKEQAMQTQRTPQIKYKQEETKLGEEYAPATKLIWSSSLRVAVWMPHCTSPSLPLHNGITLTMHTPGKKLQGYPVEIP